MAKYKKTFEIRYYEADKNKKATPLSILSYLGETSGAHTDSIDFKLDKDKSLNYGWMLNRWRVEINRYPKVGERITIETWSSGVDRFYATREFIIYDESNNEICRASTLWILVNMMKKRPIRIPDEFSQAMEPIDEKNFEEFYQFRNNMEIEDYIDFHVRRSDIDSNNHVNNTKYISWIVETIPEEIYENFYLYEFEIQYKKETKYGNTILSGCEELPVEEDKVDFIHTIMDDNLEENHALGITRWKRVV